MKTIYKYAIPTTDFQEVRMPRGAEVLCVQMQHDIPCVWALVDREEPLVGRLFSTYGTGHTINLEESAKYVGTYQLHGGALVFHVFDRGEVA
jgi:hypothetical protein